MAEYLTLLGVRAEVYGYDQFDPAYYLKIPQDAATAGVRNSESWLNWTTTNVIRNAPWMANIHIRKSDSAAAANLHDDQSVFAVFVDAGHDFDHVTSDLQAWLPKIQPGGILAGHDIDHDGVRRALEQSGLDWKKVSKSSWMVNL